MKSTFLIFAAAASCNLLPLAAEEANYSLWPRRPAELEQARELVRGQKYDEAVALLRPFVGDQGIAGREARLIAASVNVRRYLTRQHPHATVRTVKRGDTMERIASASKCPSDLIMLLNGMVEPSALKIGQKLVTVEMVLRAEIHLEQRELSVWDGRELVADYEILSVDGLGGQGNVETTLASREGTIGGLAVARRSSDFPASDRMLRLGNGLVLAGEKQQAGGAVLRLRQRDVSELCMLLGVGNRVSIVRDADAFYAAQAPAAAAAGAGAQAVEAEDAKGGSAAP